jgi:hypothetical protein
MNPGAVLRVVEKIEPVITKKQDDDDDDNNNNNIPPRDGALILLNVKVVVWSLHSPIYTAWWVNNLQLMIMNVQKGEN